MFEQHAPLAIRLDGSAFQLSWMSAMLYNCSPERYAINKERMLRVSNYSRQCLAQLRADTGIQFEGRSAGTLQLFRSQKQVEQAQRDMEVLKECGIAYEAAGQSRDLPRRTRPGVIARPHRRRPAPARR